MPNSRSYYNRSNKEKEYKQRIIKTWINDKGYFYATLWKNSKQYKRSIHKLVMLAFVGPCPEGLEVCHYDGEKSNNHLDNLRYDTRSANRYDSMRHGTLKNNLPKSKLSENDIIEIRELCAIGMGTMKVAKKYNITHGAIRFIATGERRRDIGGPIKGIDY